MSTKNLQSGCLDVIVIEQKDGSLRSTPFQILFSYFALSKAKNDDVQIEINNIKTDVKMSLNKNGRALFQKKFIKNSKSLFDSSDYSSEDDASERDGSMERSKSPKRSFVQNPSKFNAQIAKLSAMNEPAPFWQFFWQTKKPDAEIPTGITKKEKQEQLPTLEKIVEQDYEGEETSNDPDFLLSLCGDYLQKNQSLSSKEILKLFYTHQVKEKDFMKDPLSYIGNQNLVIKIKESIYTYEIGLAILIAKYAFNNELTTPQINEIIEKKKTGGWLRFLSSQKKKFVIETDNTEPQAPPTDHKTLIVPSEETITRMVKVPSSDILKRLNLRKGVNNAKFSINGHTLECRIYLWDYKTKIVVSDIDGTITTSDVFGQLMHVFKQKYIHGGVIKLFKHFKEQGYEMVYLTARAISQYKDTQQFLFEFLHDDDTHMPLGPVFTSPDGLYSSFKRQVIDKQPDFLKTQILTVIKECFPLTVNPYFCGFGNKNTDAVAYNKLIDPNRIYIISQNSQIYIPCQKQFRTNYSQLLEKFVEYFGEDTNSKLSEGTDSMYSPVLNKEMSATEMGETLKTSVKLNEKSKSVGEVGSGNGSGEPVDYDAIQI